jgi:hypothetical protein
MVEKGALYETRLLGFQQLSSFGDGWSYSALPRTLLEDSFFRKPRGCQEKK